MTAPRSDHTTTPQHWFSEKEWSQHSETTVELGDFCHAIKPP